jgi:hypothetical protein
MHGPSKCWYPAAASVHGVNKPQDRDLRLHRRESLTLELDRSDHIGEAEVFCSLKESNKYDHTKLFASAGCVKKQ